MKDGGNERGRERERINCSIPVYNVPIPHHTLTHSQPLTPLTLNLLTINSSWCDFTNDSSGFM